MTRTPAATEIKDGIRANLQGHHDTVYCNETVEQKLINHGSAAVINSSSVDSISFFGCRVEPLPGIERPIVCQKGEVFPLAKDFKNGWTEAERV